MRISAKKMEGERHEDSLRYDLEHDVGNQYGDRRGTMARGDAQPRDRDGSISLFRMQ